MEKEIDYSEQRRFAAEITSSLKRDALKPLPDRKITTPVGPNMNPLGKQRPPSGNRKST